MNYFPILITTHHEQEYNQMIRLPFITVQERICQDTLLSIRRLNKVGKVDGITDVIHMSVPSEIEIVSCMNGGKESGHIALSV